MKNILKNNRLFRKMLFSYLPIFYLIIIIIFLVSTLMIRESSQKQILKTNEAFASHAVSILEQTLKFVEASMINEIDQNENLMDYVYASDRFDKYYYANQVSDRFNSIVVNNKWIQSIYLYRFDDDTVLSSSLSTKVGEYGDENFIRSLSDSFPAGWTNKREYRELEYDRPVNVFSLVKPFPLLTAEKGYIVINVSVQTIENLLEEMTQAEIGYINLYDSEGQLIIGSANDDMSRVQSSYLGWTVGTRITETSLLEWTSSFTWWWIVFGLCAVLVGTLAIIIISLKHAKPIEEISRKIVGYVDQAFVKRKKGRNDEFQLIQTALDKLITESNKSQKHFKENIAYRRQKLFQELPKADQDQANKRWASVLKDLEKKENYDEISIFIIEIDNYGGFCSRFIERDRDLLRYALTNAAKEMIEERGIEVWMDWISPQRVAQICFLQQKQSESLEACWNDLKDWVKQNLKFTVTIGVSEAILDAERMHVSFKHSLAALDYKSVYGYDSIISFEAIEKNEQGDVFEHLMVIRSISVSFREGDPKWKSAFDGLLDTLRARKYSRTEIANLLHYLVYQLYKEISALPRLGEDPILKLNQAAEAVETIGDIEGAFRSVLEEVGDQLEVFRNTQSNKGIVYEVRAYIEQNYANPDLSLSLLSETFSISASYLSRLFKEAFNQNFVDFLAHVRIEHAKAMLQSTDDTLQDIAEKVGYSHYFSFSRVFKKLEKVPVSQYRKMIESKTNNDF
ncbi:AraC family transcriptional regulator [Paenibacillus sp. HB172176]|uniref:AraC family transcriptional regulator n=1 Tax=Paenibacillus sp. HB172176 TaxID=2493690 RepID=UPI0014394587|nr:AraC family transcriptional regulator [Paenibacillus sp. HB172176]